MQRFLFALFFIAVSIPCYAQHTDHDITVAFAKGGQSSLLSDRELTRGFYTNPFIARVQYLATTNGIQGLYAFLEYTTETRKRQGLWSDFSQQPTTFNANLDESLSLTTLGLEFIRTLYSESGFRLGAGMGVGLVLGNAVMNVHRIPDGYSREVESCQLWKGMMASIYTRARYTIYQAGSTDVGVYVTLRYWGYPTLSPLGECSDTYNGPPLRSLHQLGYLAGVSFGF